MSVFVIKNQDEAEKAITELIGTIEATGGLVRNDNGFLAPAADEDWSDLTDAYLTARQAVGKIPVVAR